MNGRTATTRTHEPQFGQLESKSTSVLGRSARVTKGSKQLSNLVAGVRVLCLQRFEGFRDSAVVLRFISFSRLCLDLLPPPGSRTRRPASHDPQL